MEPSTNGILYVVATPIGNIKDISYRAVETLAAVDTIAAEDTRHSAGLLQHYSIQTPCIAVHEHNERQIAARIVEQLKSGHNVALISDAGTPLISDPGYYLVKTAREAGISIIPVPGPSAFTAALSVSGLPSDRFVFEGFLSSKGGARKARLEQLQGETRTLIFYEAPHRIADCLRDMAQVFGESRPAVLAREITKTFETIKLAPLAELAHWVGEDSNQQRGEIVILVHGAEQGPQASDEDIDQLLAVLLEDMPTKQAAAIAAKVTGQKKKILYERALQLQNKK